MKRFLLSLLVLVLAIAAVCLGKPVEPVAWKLVEVDGQAIQVKDGTRAWHKVTIQNTGGTTAKHVEMTFRMPGLVEYGDGIILTSHPRGL